MIKIYLADDHAVVRDGLRALLEADPEITVVGASGDGRLAVSEVQELQPDVILMDISMPGLNGIDATHQILDSSPQARVIILSMLGTPEHVYRALQAGASGYLLKESAGREVLAAVLAVHAGDTYLSQPVTQTLIHDYLRRRGQGSEKAPLGSLSPREREILQLVVAGKSSAEIGEILHLSAKTVESYRSRMMQKLGVSDLPHLVLLALREGLISLD